MSFPAGGVLVDKPVGPTSHDVVASLRKAAGIRRVGHAGTLDPFASGLLLVLFGSATRLAEYFLGMDKSYQATVHLGVETETHDPEGAVVQESDAWMDVSIDELTSAARALTGRIAQRPPAYSAKKVGGEAAHRRVRRGETVALKDVDVDVYEFAIASFNPPQAQVTIRCSSGTYVRSLARDLGRILETGAHLVALRRTFIGPFLVGDALGLDPMPDRGALEKAVLPPVDLLGHLPSWELTQEEAQRMRQGQFLPVPDDRNVPAGPIRALYEGNLVAVAWTDQGWLKPKKVLAHG